MSQVECKCGRGRGKGRLVRRLLGSVAASNSLAVAGNGRRDMLIVSATFTPAVAGADVVRVTSGEINGAPQIAAQQHGTPEIRISYAEHGDLVMQRLNVVTGADVATCYVWEVEFVKDEVQ